MMQRSAWLLPAAAVVSSLAVYYVYGDMPAITVFGGWLLGGLMGRLAAGPKQKRAKLTRVGRPRPPTVKRATIVQARDSATFTELPMESGEARIDPHATSLRLTGDILRGMQTGGKTTRGKCSRCGSTLWLSARRPVRAKCPVCGFSRVLTR
jgi:DNA-directed RNA polymerase subunit RPC12/RpoP